MLGFLTRLLYFRHTGAIIYNIRKRTPSKGDRENGMGEQKKNPDTAFGRKSTIFGILAVIALAAACVVFEVLCLKYFKTGFIARHTGALIAAACAFTAVCCAV